MIKPLSIMHSNNADSKFTVINSKSSSTYNSIQFNQDCDVFIKPQKHKNISFTGYRGANGYGSQADRDALSYRVRLTPEVIRRNLQASPTVQEGVAKNYGLLIVDVNHYSRALGGLLAIGTDYAKTAAHRYKEIKEMAPKGARIWVVGVVPQLASIFTGSFKKQVERYCTELTDDIDAIVNTHVFGNVESMIDRYNQAHDGFVETLPGLKSHALKKKYIDALDITSDKLNRNIAFACGVFNKLRDTSYANKAAVIGAQHKSQVTRTTLKVGMNAIGGGLLGTLGVDELIAQAGIPLLSNVAGADLLGNAISGVSNEVIASVSEVTLENIGSGNLAKERLIHSISSGARRMTEGSLVNVLRRMK